MSELLDTVTENLKKSIEWLYGEYSRQYYSKSEISYLEKILRVCEDAYRGALVDSHIDILEWDLEDSVSNLKEECIDKLDTNKDPCNLEVFKEELIKYIDTCKQEAEYVIEQLGEKIEMDDKFNQ